MADRTQEEIIENLKKLRDEAKLKAHLASMDAKDLWTDTLEPKLKQFEHQLDDATADNPIAEELIKLEHQVRDFVNKLVED